MAKVDGAAVDLGRLDRIEILHVFEISKDLRRISFALKIEGEAFERIRNRG